jgi:hypothetical protein
MNDLELCYNDNGSIVRMCLAGGVPVAWLLCSVHPRRSTSSDVAESALGPVALKTETTRLFGTRRIPVPGVAKTKFLGPCFPDAGKTRVVVGYSLCLWRSLLGTDLMQACC